MSAARRACFILTSGLLPVLLAPCGSGPAGGAQRLPGSAGSLEELSRTVLAGLAAADTLALEAVRLTEREHNEMVYPELPASAAVVNHPAELAWQNIGTRNRAALLRLLSAYQGRALTFIEAECRGRDGRGTPESFASFVVHTDCWVAFERDGVPLPPQQLFKDILDWAGELKIFRYYDP